MSIRARHARIGIVAELRERFEREQAERGQLLRRTPGFVKWTVLRNQAQPGVYFVQTFWQDAAEVPLSIEEGGAQIEDCHIIFDEVAEPPLSPTGSAGLQPWTFHVVVQVKPGGGAVYERWKVAEGIGQRAARGFIKRTLLRSKVDPLVYYYQSFWEDESFSHTYSQSAAFTEPFARLNPAPVFAVPMLREDCDIVCDDAVVA